MAISTSLPVVDIDTLQAITKTPVNVAIDPESLAAITSSHPFLPVPGALNLRTIHSPNLKPNTIFRSGTLSHLSPSVVSELARDYNIHTIFDLRSKAEVLKHPDPEVPGVELILMSESDTPEPVDVMVLKVEDGDPVTPRKRMDPEEYVANGGVDAYLKMYFNVLENTHAETYRAFFEHLIKKPEGGVLFHCMAGKDRTGILAALILSLVGASRAEIAHDYVLTRIGVESKRDFLLGALMRSLGREVNADTFKEPGVLALCGTNERNITSLLDVIDERWGKDGKGGVEGYLVKVLQFGKEDIEKIKRRLML